VCCKVPYNEVIPTSGAHSNHCDELHLNVFISFPIQVKRKPKIVKYCRNNSPNPTTKSDRVYEKIGWLELVRPCLIHDPLFSRNIAQAVWRSFLMVYQPLELTIFKLNNYFKVFGNLVKLHIEWSKN
jgi:hypothetical protein